MARLIYSAVAAGYALLAYWVLDDYCTDNPFAGLCHGEGAGRSW